MGLDQSKMGNVVAKQMEALEADYGDDCEIGDVCTIVEVLGPHGSHLRVRSSDMRPAHHDRPAARLGGHVPRRPAPGLGRRRGVAAAGDAR